MADDTIQMILENPPNEVVNGGCRRTCPHCQHFETSLLGPVRDGGTHVCVRDGVKHLVTWMSHRPAAPIGHNETVRLPEGVRHG